MNDGMVQNLKVRDDNDNSHCIRTLEEPGTDDHFTCQFPSKLAISNQPSLASNSSPQV